MSHLQPVRSSLSSYLRGQSGFWRELHFFAFVSANIAVMTNIIHLDLCVIDVILQEKNQRVVASSALIRFSKDSCRFTQLIEEFSFLHIWDFR